MLGLSQKAWNSHIFLVKKFLIDSTTLYIAILITSILEPLNALPTLDVLITSENGVFGRLGDNSDVLQIVVGDEDDTFWRYRIIFLTPYMSELSERERF